MMAEPLRCCVCKVRESTRLCDKPIAVERSEVRGYRDSDVNENVVYRLATDYHTCDAPLCDVCAYELWNTLTPRFDDTWDFCPEHAIEERRHDMRITLDGDALAALRAELHRDCFSLWAKRGAMNEVRP
jgi:hypothetical protein